MNILLVGSGGREHALAWKIKASPLVKRLVCAPGNPGMAALGECRPVRDVDVAGQVALAREIGADLVVIGPDAAVAAGLADALAEAGIPAFGPTQAAGQLELSKAFTKELCAVYGIPTADADVFSDAVEAKAFLDRFKPPYVIKADGLALGKGVIIAENRPDAEAAIDEMLGGRFGAAGAVIVIEEFMTGEEASLFALSDGTTTRFFGGAQDHKRAYDGDLGPNTGGMGTYSPAPILSAEVQAKAMHWQVDLAITAMGQEGNLYAGVLYAGLMIEDGEPRLVEYNARFGDPECQVLMLRLKSDVVPYLLACAKGTLADLPEAEWDERAAICVVMAADGYPESPVKGSIIKGAEADFGPDVVVFQAGTARDPDGTLRANGGRVLNVCAVGSTLQEARDRAYAAVDAIDWPGGFHRRDIGWRALTG